jgi:hypothetical protein
VSLLFPVTVFILILAIGQLEGTILQAFIKAANLRRWLSRPDCPAVIKECKRLFDKAYNQKGDDYGPNEYLFEADNIATKVSVPNDLQPLLAEKKVGLRARFKHDGIVYARSSTHVGNSLVHFYPDGCKSSTAVPGSIKYIFDGCDGISFAVQRHFDADPGTSDPFALYPDFPAKLYSTTLSDKLEIVKVEWIKSHFARWRMSSEHVVVVSLSKVSKHRFILYKKLISQSIVLGYVCYSQI